MISSRTTIFFFDFDGTLSPIIKNPNDAVVPRGVKKRLKMLSHRDDVTVAIITGRAMKDILQRAGIPGIIYAANHGMEIFSHGRYLLRKGGRFRRILSLLAGKLQSDLSGIPGVTVENKGLSVAVHYRMVHRRLHGKVRKIVGEVSAPWIKAHGLTLTKGKSILEVRPAALWNKGKAALWIWRRLAPRALPVYIGDDATDEDAFTALRPYGVTIRIGKKKGSHAQYFLPSFSGLNGLLKAVSENTPP